MAKLNNNSNTEEKNTKAISNMKEGVVNEADRREDSSTAKEDKKRSSGRRNRKARSNRNKDRNSSKRGNSSNGQYGDRHNDPRWYFLSDDIMKQAASISFNTFLGASTQLDLTNGAGVVTKGYLDLPTIDCIELNPCPGRNTAAERWTGIQLASRSVYTALSSVNAKTTNYAPSDITMLLLSLGEVVSVLEHIRRAFGVYNTYSQRNRDLPANLLEMMGFNYSDFAESNADKRLQFNSWITAFNQVPFLSNIAYLQKCADLYQHIYLDDPNAMAQIYFYKPYSTWVLDEAYDTNGTGLSTRVLPLTGLTHGSNTTWDSWAKVVEEMIDKLFNSTTYNYIYADILNYAQKNSGAKLLYLDYLVEGYTVPFEYNANALLQIHNATIVGRPNDIAPTGYTKKNDVSSLASVLGIAYNPTFAAEIHLKSPIIDFKFDSPSTEDIVEATRFTAVLDGKITTGTTTVSVPVILPDHYVVSQGQSLPCSRV